MTSIYDWSTTPASNATVGSINWAENQNPSTVNDSARQEMADVAAWRDFLGGAKISSGTDTITLTSGLSLSAYAQGQLFAFEAGGTNTGAVTLNVDSVGAKAIKKHHDVDLAAGDFEAGGIYIVAYEATADNFQLISAVSNTAGTVTPSSTDTFTNKTFDANGTGNSISNIDVADLAGGTDGELITWDTSGNPTTVAVGTSGQVLTSNGAGAAPTFQDGSAGITLASAQATTSGTAFNFGSIPAGVNDIIVMFDQVSLDGTDNFLVQLGDAGGIETSSYLSRSGQVAGTTQVGSASGLIIRRSSATDTTTGWMRITRMSGNKWVSGHTTTQDTGTNDCHNGGGVKELSAELTQVTITRSGTNNFDAGSVAIAYLS